MAPPPVGKPKAGPRGAGMTSGHPPSGGGVAVEIRFDPAFVEEAVFLELNRLTIAGSRQAVSSFHREREAVYELPDAQQRDAAFQQLARRTFHALGLAEPFTERLSEFPHVSGHVELLVVRRVWNRKDEQVELYVGGWEARPALEVSTTLFIGLQAIRCLDRGKLTAFLRHELMHVADMLDPTFAYDPHVALAPPPAGKPEAGPRGAGIAKGNPPSGGGVGGECEPEDELIRGRFRVLWDLWVHARMRRRQWHTILDDDARQRDVMRAFAFFSPLGQEELFTAVNRQDHWTQGELLALARLPAEALAQAGHAHSEVAT